jgi:toxin ParE1/3/4
MGQLVFSPLAEADLGELLDFIARDKPDAALTFVQTIREVCTVLADNPQMGELRPDIAAGIRAFTVRNEIIFFRQVSDGIQVARVIHGARDLKDLWFG